MITTGREYRSLVEQLQQEDAQIEAQRQLLVQAGLNTEQLQAAMAPLLTFREQLREAVEFYERIKAGDFSRLSSFDSIGRLLIALRIAANISQHELAVRLQVSDVQVSRDERNEYFGATLPKVAAVLRALGVQLRHTVGPMAQPSDVHTLKG